MSLQEQESRCLAGSTQSTFRGALRVLYVCLAVMLLSAEKGVPRKALGPVLVACLVCVSQRRVAAGQRVNSRRRAHRVTSPTGGSLRGRRLCRALHLTVGHADPEISELSPMPRHLGGLSRSRPNSESRIRYSDQTGIPDFPNPGFRPNRGSSFPESRDSGQIRIQIPTFFCSGQNRDCTLAAAGPASAVPCRGPWVGAEAHRPATRSRQRLQAPAEAHTT